MMGDLDSVRVRDGDRGVDYKNHRQSIDVECRPFGALISAKITEKRHTAEVPAGVFKAACVVSVLSQRRGPQRGLLGRMELRDITGQLAQITESPLLLRRSAKIAEKSALPNAPMSSLQPPGSSPFGAFGRWDSGSHARTLGILVSRTMTLIRICPHFPPWDGGGGRKSTPSA